MKVKNIINFPSALLRKIASLFASLGITLLFTHPLCAKEPELIIIGAGVGAGQTRIDIEHSQVMRHPILGGDTTGTQANKPMWDARYNTSSASFALAWEFLFGYKHFVNDWAGFRYYANVGVQHYKPTGSNKEHFGLIDYTVNADLLIDFYESERWAFGVFGGVGFGGSSFHRDAINHYLDTYNANEQIPIGASDVKQHFFNITASAGVRVVIFQRATIRGGIRTCDSYATDKKRTCTSPVRYTGHAFEAVAKFPVLEYNATDFDVMSSTNNKSFVSRPGYKIKNSYRFLFRYIVEF